jgi:hypothetical protein
MLHALLERPAIALWLTIPAAQSSKVGSGLLAPTVFVLVIAHAVDMIVVCLDAHTGSVFLDPLA